jgi:hypothetical protein
VAQSSYDVLPDDFSILQRQVYLEVRAPQTGALGFELRPEKQARNILRQSQTAAGDALSCEELSAVVDVVNDPRAGKDYDAACRTPAGANGNGVNGHGGNGGPAVGSNGHGHANATAGVSLRTNRIVRPILR